MSGENCGRQQYLVGPEVEQTTHGVAQDVVGQDARRGAEGIALVAPFRGRLNRIEPPAACRRPHRFVLQANRHGKVQGLHRQRDCLAGVQRGQFEREVDRMVRPASSQPAPERAHIAGEKHLPEIRRTDDCRQSQAAVRLPAGRQERRRRHERIERKGQFQPVHAAASADQLHRQPAAGGSNRPVDVRAGGGQAKLHAVGAALLPFAGQSDRRLRRALFQRNAGAQQVALRPIAAFGVPTQQRQSRRSAIGLDSHHRLPFGVAAAKCNNAGRPDRRHRISRNRAAAHRHNQKPQQNQKAVLQSRHSHLLSSMNRGRTEFCVKRCGTAILAVVFHGLEARATKFCTVPINAAPAKTPLYPAYPPPPTRPSLPSPFGRGAGGEGNRISPRPFTGEGPGVRAFCGQRPLPPLAFRERGRE